MTQSKYPDSEMHNTARSWTIKLLLLLGFVYAPQGFTQNISNTGIERNQIEPTQETPDLIPFAEEKMGEYERAIESYLQLIENIEAREGQFSTKLVDPLLGLSRSYLALNELVAAEDSAARAQHLQHRDEGVLSLDQLAVIEIKTRIHLLEGKPSKADKQQRFAFYLAERNHGVNSLDALPATYKLIDWYTATGQYFKAQRLLVSTIKSFNEKDGQQHEGQQVVLLPALLRSARLRRLRGIAGQHRHLESALKVITEHPNIAQERKTEVYLALADAYLIENRFADSQKYYQITWDNLPQGGQVEQFSQPKELALSNVLNESTSTGYTEYRTNSINRLNSSSRDFLPFDRNNELKLSEPQKLVLPFQEDDYAVLFNENSNDPGAHKTFKVVGEPFRFVREQLVGFLPARLKSDAGLATVNIEMVFSVNAEGRTYDINVTSEQATGRLLRTMRRILAKTRFRPQLADGKPVATKVVKLTQTFRTPSA
jgi:tetratricopeptide (TPR) repeat protein